MLEVLISQSSLSDLQATQGAQATDTGLWVQQILYSSEEIALLLATTASASTCPVCQLDSARVHSRYRRALFDLPVGAQPVRLQLQVRRFFCPTSDYPRCIFAERVPVPGPTLCSSHFTHGYCPAAGWPRLGGRVRDWPLTFI